jgi:hypothetical protein
MTGNSSKKTMRKFIRAKIEFEVRYQPIKNQNWYKTVTKSIGTDGICLISMEYLGIGATVKIQMSLTNTKKYIIVIGDVIWSNFLIDRKLYESGIKFRRLDNIDKDLISKHIDEFFYLRTDTSKT